MILVRLVLMALVAFGGLILALTYNDILRYLKMRSM